MPSSETTNKMASTRAGIGWDAIGTLLLLLHQGNKSEGVAFHALRRVKAVERSRRVSLPKPATVRRRQPCVARGAAGGGMFRSALGGSARISSGSIPPLIAGGYGLDLATQTRKRAPRNGLRHSLGEARRSAKFRRLMELQETGACGVGRSSDFPRRRCSLQHMSCPAHASALRASAV